MSGKRRLLVVVGACAAAGVAYGLVPVSAGELARRTAGIFVIAAVLWATEALPLFATSLCVIGLEILLLAGDGSAVGVGAISYKDFFAPFSSGIIILFMGGLLLSSAMTKHGIDRAIAARFLGPFCARPIALVYGVLAITAFFSMWMSNTATTAMMLAVVAPLIRDVPVGDRFPRAVVLAVPMGANIGGIGTPIGTPPNAVAVAALRAAGYRVGFLDWMIVAVPLAVMLLAAVGLLLYVSFPPGKGIILRAAEAPEKVGLHGKLTVGVLVTAIVLWLTAPLHGLAESVVALLAAAALTGMRVLDRRDVNSIDWDVLLLMWGGLSLGLAMQVSGLVGVVADAAVAGLSGGVLAVAVVVVSIGLSTFMSNTATANLVVPMAMAMPADERVSLVMLTALACSFAMAMPVSTPPNAIAFATGKIPISALIRSGGLIGLIGAVLLLVGYRVVLPMLFDVQLVGG